MDKLIEEFKVKVVEPGCSPGSGRFGILIELQNDISEVLPYVNSSVVDGYYDHDNHILIWKEAFQAYAFHPKEIGIARIDDPLQAGQIADELVGKINQIWQNRHNISPSFSERRLPTTIALFKLLPKINCKQCGFSTCLSFDEALRTGQIELETCTALLLPKYADNRANLLSILRLNKPST
jgi:ArsR family metal-binding transcriptional regulator